MTLPLPHLDRLRYDQLVAQARDLLPYRAPQWTDHNAHDPGITLLELLAWRTEGSSYRLDRVGAASERAFLRLVGYPARPAQVARAVVTFEALQASAAIALPAGVQLCTADARIRFQTISPFQVAPARLVGLFTRDAIGWTQHAPGAGFLPFGAQPAPDDALYLQFDRAPAPAGSRVRLFAATADPAGDAQTWRELHAEHRRSRRDASEGCRRGAACASGFWEHPGVRVAWEYFDGSLWRALPDLRDATRALSLSGPLRFRVPTDLQAGGVPGREAQFLLRCRVLRGEYDCPPRLAHLWWNALLVRHAADNPVRALGISNGHALQRFDLAREAIVPGSTHVTATAPDGQRSDWTEQADFDRSGPLARDFIVDAAYGQAVFGDGRSARVPDAGAQLAASWRSGGGAAGNLPAGSLVALADEGPALQLPGWPLLRTTLEIAQPVAACGGAEAEASGAAKARAVRSIAQARCAVTLPDFEALALRVPGAPVARAHAVAGFQPQLACLPAAGCITVVVLGPCVRSHPSPTLALCRAVRRFLDARRPVATEVHVCGPDWTRISVRATLRTRPGPWGAAGPGSLPALAVRHIDAFFDPLTGGPGGGGWPFGRPVYRSEVLALLDALPGVAAVERLALVREGETEDLCNNVPLCPHGLVLAGDHAISVSPETTR